MSPRLPRRHRASNRSANRLPAPILPRIAAVTALCAVLVAVIIVIESNSGSSGAGTPTATRTKASTKHPGKKHTTNRSKTHTTSKPKSTLPTLSLAKAVGQTLIATYSGTVPPTSLLDAITAGQVGGIILMPSNTAGGASSVKTATKALQAAAKQGHNPGLLIMTDQEGGSINRLSGPPTVSASEMSNPATARSQGTDTARFLKQVGINVDLAPVADVTRVDGFMTQEGRTFGDNPTTVANATCAFAGALAKQRVAYTLKHFPGLGDAYTNTDDAPVTVSESAAEINADDAAYRKCGSSPLALVMISSASYTSLTGTTPAVLSPSIYSTTLKQDHVSALPITDNLEAGALSNVSSPAATALSAGADMIMYATDESTALGAYPILVKDAQQGTLSPSRIQAAAARILRLKRSLKLPT